MVDKIWTHLTATGSRLIAFNIATSPTAAPTPASTSAFTHRQQLILHQHSFSYGRAQQYDQRQDQRLDRQLRLQHIANCITNTNTYNDVYAFIYIYINTDTITDSNTDTRDCLVLQMVAQIRIHRNAHWKAIKCGGSEAYYLYRTGVHQGLYLEVYLQCR